MPLLSRTADPAAERRRAAMASGSCGLADLGGRPAHLGDPGRRLAGPRRGE